jgi:polysaccharide biosynthesis transport protein
MEGLITDTNNQIANTRDSSALQQLEARLTQYRTIYSNLVTSYEQVRLAEEQTSTNVVVSEPANIPSLPVKPKTLMNTLSAGFMGILLAVGVRFLSNTLDDTIKNPEETQRKFNVPILGVIDLHKVPEDNRLRWMSHTHRRWKPSGRREQILFLRVWMRHYGVSW